MSEKALRILAINKGYTIRKCYRRYTNNNALVKDENGNAIPGYAVIDNRLGCFVWGCYNEIAYGLWSLAEVADFLKHADVQEV